MTCTTTGPTAPVSTTINKQPASKTTTGAAASTNINKKLVSTPKATAATSKSSTTRETSTEKWKRQKAEGPDLAKWAKTLPLPDGEDPAEWTTLPFDDSYGGRYILADLASQAGIVLYMFKNGFLVKEHVTNERQEVLDGKQIDPPFTFQRLEEDLRHIALARQDEGDLIVAFRDLAPFEHDPPVDGDDGNGDGDNGGNGDGNGGDDGNDGNGGIGGDGTDSDDEAGSDIDEEPQWDSDTISTVSSLATTATSNSVVDNMIAPGGVVQKAQLSEAMAEYIAHSK
ncbi:hypothetical protein HDU87_005584 [Geranomyces variabilis]|uniref:Uncharacterized protein n=1 Tax=Geranomyces variabilis TaxID=109894 RepID=A0AAD5TM64_9FUNG|nr:hypothetical protein HDU87_005584 [Geranomyces variabilis]